MHRLFAYYIKHKKKLPPCFLRLVYELSKFCPLIYETILEYTYQFGGICLGLRVPKNFLRESALKMEESAKVYGTFYGLLCIQKT